ncbi:hypothetical protein Ldro_0859, partial [Legionella drozanskii LLAP-1]
WLKIIRLSPVAWQHINLIGKYEFYYDKECLNLHKVIQNLIANKKIDLLARGEVRIRGKIGLFKFQTAYNPCCAWAISCFY